MEIILAGLSYNLWGQNMYITISVIFSCPIKSKCQEIKMLLVHFRICKNISNLNTCHGTDFFHVWNIVYYVWAFNFETEFFISTRSDSEFKIKIPSKLQTMTRNVLFTFSFFCRLSYSNSKWAFELNAHDKLLEMLQ
jgi:hypothetical protein